jgi:hypothetical protein
MPTLQSHRRPASKSTRGHGRGTLDRPQSRKRAGSPETWITDPGALLEALAAAENATRLAEEAASRPVTPVEPISAFFEPVPEASTPEPLPTLREDERFGHTPNGAVVVIIRRRRAA